MRGTIAIAALLAALAAAPAAAQEPPLPETGGAVSVGPDTKRLRFSYGPILVAPGQNLILAGPVTVEKPAYDGYVTRFRPDLVRADGSVPPVDVVHLHHGVWLNLSQRDLTWSGVQGERLFASGEEKTVWEYPEGYGYPLRASDVLAVNYMLHNQTAVPETVWITWEMDFVAASSPTGQTMRTVRPVWMDVENQSAYPVFDVRRGSGGDGRFTYPDEASSPYGTRPPKNVWTVPRGGGALLWNVGHVHPGGLWTDLEVERTGAGRQLLFRSEAEYFNDRPPVSWDMAMTVPPKGWRVGLKQGDRLRVSATYETERASWYESMGIVVGLFAPSETGPDPFATPPQTSGAVTHGPLPENSNFGGEDTGLPDPRTLPDGQTLDGNVGIFGFVYTPGNFGTPLFGNPATVEKPAEVKFHNGDAGALVYHTVTACKAPCTGTTGIGYPLADGDVDFDSGELGYGPPGLTAAANRHTWTLDTEELDPGTYTYFCRVHPFMRGALRVR